MANQLYFEDIQENMELPSLKKHPTTRQLVKWAGASGDFYEAHYDEAFAQKQGLQGIIVHGLLGLAFMGQMMVDWIGEPHRLKKMGCRYVSMLQPNQDLVCKGKVTKKYAEGGENCVDCDLWLEDSKGQKASLGAATVSLPSRA